MIILPIGAFQWNWSTPLTISVLFWLTIFDDLICDCLNEKWLFADIQFDLSKLFLVFTIVQWSSFYILEDPLKSLYKPSKFFFELFQNLTLELTSKVLKRNKSPNLYKIIIYQKMKTSLLNSLYGLF